MKERGNRASPDLPGIRHGRGVERNRPVHGRPDRIAVDGRSAFREAAACRDPAGVEPRPYFQLVPEGKVAKNRMHLGIHIEPGRKEAEVARVTELGAELVETHDDRGPLTYVMRDPEGNEFCLH